jgi:hypothetical protein
MDIRDALQVALETEKWEGFEHVVRTMQQQLSSPLVCMLAAMHSLDALHRVRCMGFPWNEQVCVIAACSGDLDMLRYAHENGCPWSLRGTGKQTL